MDRTWRKAENRRIKAAWRFITPFKGVLAGRGGGGRFSLLSFSLSIALLLFSTLTGKRKGRIMFLGTTVTIFTILYYSATVPRALLEHLPAFPPALTFVLLRRRLLLPYHSAADIIIVVCHTTLCTRRARASRTVTHVGAWHFSRWHVFRDSGDGGSAHRGEGAGSSRCVVWVVVVAHGLMEQPYMLSGSTIHRCFK